MYAPTATIDGAQPRAAGLASGAGSTPSRDPQCAEPTAVELPRSSVRPRRGTSATRCRKLGLIEASPIDDPVAALMDLGGEAVALVTALKRHVAELERVGTEPGRWVRQSSPRSPPTWPPFGRPSGSCRQLVRLNLAERLVRIDEERAQLVVTVIERVLMSAGLDPQSLDVRASVARELTVVAG